MSAQNLRTKELRVAIRFTTTRIPGPAAERAKRIANDFAVLNLHREFTWDSDHIHYPSDFDSEEKKALWMLVDFNIVDQVFDVNSILTQYWKVGYDDSETSLFAKREVKGARFVSMFPWGRRPEEWEFRLKEKAGKVVDEMALGEGVD